MAFCLVGDKVPCKDSKGSKIVPIWSKKTKEVFMFNSSLKFEIKAKQFYAASQRVL